jgi:death-on-curing protein
VNEPEWVEYDVVLAIQEAQIVEHGGAPGIRDVALLESGLARPKNVFAYQPRASVYELASAYVFGIARNHPFLDGNKRTAWVVCALFLELNGVNVVASQAEVVQVMMRMAAGTVSEPEFVRWLKGPNITESCS